MNGSRLFNRGFTLLILGQASSLFGNYTLRFALSMYVLELTGSAAVFSTLLAVSMLPTILLSPLGGVLADRANRRSIMVTLDALSALGRAGSRFCAGAHRRRHSRGRAARGALRAGRVRVAHCAGLRAAAALRRQRAAGKRAGEPGSGRGLAGHALSGQRCLCLVRTGPGSPRGGGLLFRHGGAGMLHPARQPAYGAERRCALGHTRRPGRELALHALRRARACSRCCSWPRW